MSSRLFTSESVSDGHPDKICDQISDAILDAVLDQDPFGRVAMEAAAKKDTVYVIGELTTTAEIDIDAIVRKTLVGVGHGDDRWGFGANSIKVVQNVSLQSPEISDGVSRGEKVGAGDQGIMFGYAVAETPSYMPLTIDLAHRLMRVHRRNRINGYGEDFGPDAKSQITVRYDEDGRPIEIDTIVLSMQHSYRTPQQCIIDYARNLIDECIPSQYMTRETKILVNPAGRFTMGGPVADAGLTGRKIIVDTYGGAARHGGGAFSGKDPTKVDRSAAYAARWLAKNVCNALGRHRTEVQLSYAIGVPEPVSIHIYGMNEGQVKEIVDRFGPFDPSSIIDRLGLRRPIYRQTAAFGHFGRDDVELPWENVI